MTLPEEVGQIAARLDPVLGKRAHHFRRGREKEGATVQELFDGESSSGVTSLMANATASSMGMILPFSQAARKADSPSSRRIAARIWS